MQCPKCAHQWIPGKPTTPIQRFVDLVIEDFQSGLHNWTIYPESRYRNTSNELIQTLRCCPWVGDPKLIRFTIPLNLDIATIHPIILQLLDQLGAACESI